MKAILSSAAVLTVTLVTAVCVDAAPRTGLAPDQREVAANDDVARRRRDRKDGAVRDPGVQDGVEFPIGGPPGVLGET